MKLKFNFFILFLIVNSLIFFISEIYKERAISHELALSINTMRINYNTVVQNYKLSSHAMIDTFLEFPEVQQIMTKMQNVNEKEKQKLREALYKTLSEDFKTFKKMGVKLILITGKDNKVLLRMHKPDIHGDDISDVRFAVAEVNKIQKELFGFEQGKISHAYRHIYPVYNKQQQYIGNIDISFSSEGIQKSMEEVHNIHTHFLINKEVVNSRVWKVEDISAPYEQSFENNNYMTTIRNTQCSTNREIAKRVINNHRWHINEQMKNAKKFAVYGKFETDHVVVSFLPIYSIMDKKNASAYLVAYTHNIRIAMIINEFVLIRSVGFFLTLLILFTIYYTIMKRKEVLLTSKVFSTMGDGVLITDENNKIIRVNDAFADMTQFSKNEILGKNPNIIKSKWHDKEFYKALWHELNTKGQWQGEIVNRKKDGSVFTADTSIHKVKDARGVVTNYIAVSNDITQKKKQDDKIHELAYYDVLTKLPNKTFFHNLFTAEIAAAKRHNSKLALLFIDLDDFKSINDTHGHLVGDRFLKEAANRMKSVMREDDTLSRFGGDEFAIMVDDFKSVEDFSIICEKIISAFEKPFLIDAIEVYSGASIGISVYPDNALTYEELLRTADTAMYHIKHRGKNDYRFFLESMNEESEHRMKIEHALRTAMQNNEFYVVYQPKVDTVIQKIYGMETLLRWENDTIGCISPDVFIPITEENGKIYELGLWVLEQALKDTKELHDQGEKLTVSINVSGIQLEDDNFIADLDAIVDSVALAREYIELEITETNIMQNIDAVQENLNYISSSGMKISIDDFGTGYSSLSYLKKLPANTIKIDRSFILDINENDEDKELISSIIQLSKIFNMDVIAEGSETKQSIEKLSELGCTKVQGYYYSKPLRFFKFKKFLAEYKQALKTN